ncbi:peptidoglycan bridge formation glycyltransferase FemA/FemB family protein [Candidatus Pacearchaeota archaeon]|nr:peptidoglycan bridge formation glycyltransferase FemA/FemB family protein [Candidatus Pacearchaeota archaeon]
MKWKGFKDVQATIQIDLNKSLDDLWENLDKDARWGVNKAKKENLKVGKTEKEEFWNKFYDVYRDTCRRGGINPFKYSYIRKENASLLICLKEKKIIAGAVIIEDKKENKISLFLNASIPEYLNLQPNNILYWSMIVYGKKNGFKIFDLGGYQLNAKKGSKLYEINRFKERWGGEIIKYDIYSKNPFYILGRKLIRRFPLLKVVRDKLR